MYWVFFYVIIFALLFFKRYNVFMTEKISLKKIYSKNYFIFIALEIIPLMWKILEIAFLGAFENGLKIIGQVVLFSILFKMFQETILTPLYKIFGKNKQDNPVDVKKCLLWVTISSFIFTAVIFILINPIMKMSHVPDYIFDQTASFMKIYVISCGFGVCVNYLYLNSVIKKDTKQMFVYLILKSVITAAMIIILVPSFSCNLGANGVAITELSINILALVYLIFKVFSNKTEQHKKINKKEYFKLMIISFLETFVRNVAYYFIILVFLNIIDSQELYYVANNYIWSIMLVPTLAQNSLIKQELAYDRQTEMKPFFINTIIIAVYMVVMLLSSIIVYKYIYNLSNYQQYFYATLALMPCYFVFIFDAVAESYFIATGKLHHVLVQTIITNVLVYLPAFILYLCNVWIVDFSSIIILFNVGVIVASMYTIIVYCVTRNREKKQVLTE